MADENWVGIYKQSPSSSNGKQAINWRLVWTPGPHLMTNDNRSFLHFIRRHVCLSQFGLSSISDKFASKRIAHEESLYTGLSAILYTITIPAGVINECSILKMIIEQISPDLWTRNTQMHTYMGMLTSGSFRKAKNGRSIHTLLWWWHHTEPAALLVIVELNSDASMMTAGVCRLRWLKHTAEIWSTYVNWEAQSTMFRFFLLRQIKKCFQQKSRVVLWKWLCSLESHT